MVPDCLFCRIVQKQIPSSVVHETESTLAFRDSMPRAPVHVLVIPKEHVGSLMDLEARHAQLLSDIHATIQDVARKENIDASGFRVAVNNGKDSGQAVPHLHYHVLGGRTLKWPPG
jgi:histidine triad (HIT) family protein